MKRWLVFALCQFACSAWGDTEPALNEVRVGVDLPTLERGAETVITVCAGCHSLKYVRFRDLVRLGIAQDKVDAWRGGKPMGAAITGQLPADAALASFGKIPPDLSLMARAREGEADYIYSYLLGFYITPEGTLGNHYYPPTKMPDILAVAGVTDPSQRAQLEQKARAVTSFLVWAADPHARERRALGYYVIGYLLIFTTLLYFLKRRTWAKLDRPASA
ncbi:MAG TPA: cytochrome c1 [Burkholderiales bacterium]|nr:cytochrome c1 [Burkholderiales bacterium]